MWPLYAFYASVQCISLRRLEPLACAEGRVCVCMCHSSSSSSSCSALWCIRTLTFSQPHGSIFTGLAQAGKTVVYLSVHMKVCELCSLDEHPKTMQRTLFARYSDSGQNLCIVNLQLFCSLSTWLQEDTVPAQQWGVTKDNFFYRQWWPALPTFRGVASAWHTENTDFLVSRDQSS